MDQKKYLKSMEKISPNDNYYQDRVRTYREPQAEIVKESLLYSNIKKWISFYSP